MRLEPLYRARFTTPESWSVELVGSAGTEAQSFLIAEGRCEGWVTGRLRAANFPRRRTDGTLTPDFRGVLETDDGATVLFAWHGLLRSGESGRRELLGTITHLSDNERYRRLNDVVCALSGEVRLTEEGGANVVLEVSELIWEPLAAAGPQ